ncbi:hypothetical protein K438DRAFT_2074951, partial [Mycena galopus ATCC 62051]
RLPSTITLTLESQFPSLSTPTPSAPSASTRFTPEEMQGYGSKVIEAIKSMPLFKANITKYKVSAKVERLETTLGADLGLNETEFPTAIVVEGSLHEKIRKALTHPDDKALLASGFEQGTTTLARHYLNDAFDMLPMSSGSTRFHFLTKRIRKVKQTPRKNPGPPNSINKITEPAFNFKRSKTCKCTYYMAMRSRYRQTAQTAGTQQAMRQSSLTWLSRLGSGTKVFADGHRRFISARGACERALEHTTVVALVALAGLLALTVVRLHFLLTVGAHYSALVRATRSLEAGDAEDTSVQRIRLLPLPKGVKAADVVYTPVHCPAAANNLLGTNATVWVRAGSEAAASTSAYAPAYVSAPPSPASPVYAPAYVESRVDLSTASDH